MIGHLARVCQGQAKKQQYNNHCVEMEQQDEILPSDDCQNGENMYINDEDLRIFSMEVNSFNNNVVTSKSENYINVCNNVSENGNRLYTTTICTNGKMINYEIDTGSAVTTMPHSCFDKYFSNEKLMSYKNDLKAYDGTSIRTKGYFNARILFKGKSFFIDFIVVENGCRPLIGRDALKKLNYEFNLNINSVSVNRNLKGVLNEYKDLFDDTLGEFRYEKIKFKIRENVRPIFIPPRTVPFVYRDKLESELELV